MEIGEYILEWITLIFKYGVPNWITLIYMKKYLTITMINDLKEAAIQVEYKNPEKPNL